MLIFGEISPGNGPGDPPVTPLRTIENFIILENVMKGV